MDGILASSTFNDAMTTAIADSISLAGKCMSVIQENPALMIMLCGALFSVGFGIFAKAKNAAKA